MKELQYDAFISYSRSDCFYDNGSMIPGNAVSKIMEAFTAAGISYWFDKDCIYHGDDFAEKIISNIESSHVFVFISSEASNQSKWTRKEIASADMMKKKIIPFKLDKSAYDKAVMFRIVDLDYIDAVGNVDGAVRELVTSVNAQLSEIREKQKLKDKAAAREIAEIELSIAQLCANTAQVELEFRQLAQRIRSVESRSEQYRLISMVPNILRAPSMQQIDALVQENNEIKVENQKLKQAVADLEHKIEKIRDSQTQQKERKLQVSRSSKGCGYVDSFTRELIISHRFHDAKEFSEGLAAVSNGFNYGYINLSGELVIPHIYKTARPFKEGLARVSRDNKYGFIDKDGTRVIDIKYDYANPFSEGFATVRLDQNGQRRYGFINKKGEVVIPIKYNDADSFKDGFARVKLGDKWGAVNKKGEFIG